MTQPTIFSQPILASAPSDPMTIGSKVVLQDVTLDPRKVADFGDVFDSLATTSNVADVPLTEVEEGHVEELTKLDAMPDDDIEVNFKGVAPEEISENTDRFTEIFEVSSGPPKNQIANTQHTQISTDIHAAISQFETDEASPDVRRDMHTSRTAPQDDIIYPMLPLVAEVVKTVSTPSAPIIGQLNPQPYTQNTDMREARFLTEAPTTWVQPQKITDAVQMRSELSKIAQHVRGPVQEFEVANPVVKVKLASVEGEHREKGASLLTPKDVDVAASLKSQEVRQLDTGISKLVGPAPRSLTNVHVPPTNISAVPKLVDTVLPANADAAQMPPVKQRDVLGVTQNVQLPSKPEAGPVQVHQNTMLLPNARPEITHVPHERIGSREHTTENRQSVIQPHTYSIKSAIPVNAGPPISEGLQKLLPRENLRDALVQTDGWSGGSTDRITSHSVSAPAVGTPAQMQDRARQIAAQMSAAITKTTQGTTEITLNPEELGRVRMTLNPSEGVMTMSVFADRPETMDLLRRHIDQLAQEFRNMGFDSMSFTFSENGSGAGGEEQQGQGDIDFQSPIATSMNVTDEPNSKAASSGVDIRL